jgi:hypothetical protein
LRAVVLSGAKRSRRTPVPSAPPYRPHLSTRTPPAIFSEQASGPAPCERPIRRGQFGQTLSISHPLGHFTLAGEIWHFTQPLTRGNAAGNLWALSYPVRENLVVDAGLNHGLTSSFTQWQGFAGFTYLLPNHLWKTP